MKSKTDAQDSSVGVVDPRSDKIEIQWGLDGRRGVVGSHADRDFALIVSAISCAGSRLRAGE